MTEARPENVPRSPVAAAGESPAGASRLAMVVRRSLGWLARGGLLVVSFAVAVAGVFVHRWASPLGLLLAVGAAVGVGVLSRHVVSSRWGLATMALAWTAPVIVFAQPRAAGDVLIAGDPTGLTFLFGGVVPWAVILGLGVVRRRALSS